jgi:hypothetical protein
MNFQTSLHLSRRQFFGRSATSIGIGALAALLAEDGFAAGAPAGAIMPPLPGLPHHKPTAKRVIVLWQGGAPSHVDLFDHKPGLEALRGQQIPDSVRAKGRLSTMTAGQKSYPVLPPIKPFKRYGQSGTWLSEMLPHTGSIADEICLVNSMHTEAVNHAPGVTFFMSGSQIPGRPSMGAWATYGLGSMTNELPSFCVMTSMDRGKTCGQLFYDYYWGSGFLPSKYQGVRFRGEGDPVLYLANPDGMSGGLRRGMLDDIADLNRKRLADYGDPEIETRITQYEMAYRMQTSVPELLDISKEPKHILEMYGPDVERKGSFARNCLLARRLAERGVRFIQLMHAATFSSAVCSRTPSCSGAVSSAEPRSSRETSRSRTDTAATISAPRTASGSPAADSRAARSTANLTSTATTWRRTRSISTTCRRRSSTRLASTTPASPTATRAATSA